MASKRLTNALRDTIRKNIIASIEKKHTMVKTVYDEWAMAVHYEFHGQYEDILTRLPENVGYTTSSIGIYVIEDPKDEYGNFYSVNFPKSLPVFNYTKTPKISAKTHPQLFRLWLAYKDLYTAMTAEQKSAASAFNSIASGCNTLRQLQDAWPEVVAYLPPDTEGAKPLELPMDAEAIATLNRLLGR